MIRTGSTNLRRRRVAAWVAAAALGVALVPGVWPASTAAEDLVDLTLLFHSAVQGKIAPCG